MAAPLLLAAPRRVCLLVVWIFWGLNSSAAEFTCPPAFYKRHAFLIPIANGQVYIPVFRYVKKDPGKITLAMVVLHGAGQNSDNYFGWVVNSELGNSQKDNAVVIMPAFPDFACNASAWVGNENQTGETLRWSGGAWRQGQLCDARPGLPPLSSYEVVDEVIQYLQMEYRNLKRVDVVGYSSGADMGLAWSILSANGYRNLTNGGVRMRVLLGSPNVYLYLNDRRPALACSEPPSGGAVAQPCLEFLAPGSGSLAAMACAGYNSFPYGLDGLETLGGAGAVGSTSHYLHEYMDESMAKAELPAHFAMKDIIFMVSTEDIASCGSTGATCRSPRTCDALVQGRSRLQRALNYMGHLRDALPGYEPQLRTFSGKADPESFFQTSVWAESAFGDMPGDPIHHLSLAVLFSSGFLAVWFFLCLTGSTCAVAMLVVVCRQQDCGNTPVHNHDELLEGDTEEEDDEEAPHGSGA